MRTSDIDHKLLDFALPRYGVLTRAEAGTLGIGSRPLATRLASGMLTEPAPGVLVVVAYPADWRQDVVVATKTGTGAAASHRSAIALHLPEVVEEHIPEVVVRRGQRVAVPGVVVHQTNRFLPGDIMLVDGIRTTTLAVALASVGSVAPELVEIALDAARRRNTSLKWLRDTANRLHRPGQRGTGLLLDLLEEIQPGDRVRDSWFEKLVEVALTSPLLPPFHRQHEVRDARGNLVARVDGAYPVVKLAVEAHSRSFHFGSGPQSADERRDGGLAAVGWDTLYFGWHRTRSHPDEVLRTVFGAVVARGWDPVSRTVRAPRVP